MRGPRLRKPLRVVSPFRNILRVGGAVVAEAVVVEERLEVGAVAVSLRCDDVLLVGEEA